MYICLTLSLVWVVARCWEENRALDGSPVIWPQHSLWAMPHTEAPDSHLQNKDNNCKIICPSLSCVCWCRRRTMENMGVTKVCTSFCCWQLFDDPHREQPGECVPCCKPDSYLSHLVALQVQKEGFTGLACPQASC